MMIRSVVRPHYVASEQEFERLKAVLAELGFDHGEGWNDDLGKGAPFVTGLGAIELFQGKAPVAADLLVEVEDVGKALEIVQRHSLECSEELQQTHWNSTYFIVNLGGLRAAFFQFNDAKQAESEAA
jgi:hypothetical protein